MTMGIDGQRIVFRLLNVVGALAFSTVLGVAFWLSPNEEGSGTHTQLGLPPCGYLVATGRPCLTCGMTTAFAFAVRGRVFRALDANPSGLVLFALLLGVIYDFLRGAVQAGHPLTPFTTSRFRWLLPASIVTLTLVWVVRVS